MDVETLRPQVRDLKLNKQLNVIHNEQFFPVGTVLHIPVSCFSFVERLFQIRAENSSQKCLYLSSQHRQLAAILTRVNFSPIPSW
jgi:hypothetical protein